ncbi:MAG: ribosome maturation factor RimP [Gammaproteobacteria bacterium]|nr:ribosome maturation factor RimP [Gammaproteobacteria bacterium]
MGYEIVELEYKQGLVRVYIDAPGGITLDDCAAVSNQISGILDVEDPISGQYNLEISSPGADRPLRKPEHFEQFTGERVKIQLSAPQDGRRRYTGILRGIAGTDVNVEVDGEVYVIALGAIETARLAPQLES